MIINHLKQLPESYQQKSFENLHKELQQEQTARSVSFQKITGQILDSLEKQNNSIDHHQRIINKEIENFKKENFYK